MARAAAAAAAPAKPRANRGAAAKPRTTRGGAAAPAKPRAPRQAPRRRSGPAKQRAPRQAAAPRQASAPRQRPVPRQPLTRADVQRVLAARGNVLLDRLLRGRLWVACVGLLLAGIVFLNVGLLQLNDQIARTDAKSQSIGRENADLRLKLAKLDSTERIQRLAEAKGFVMPAPGAVRYVRSKRKDAREAARGMTAPEPQTPVPAPAAAAPTTTTTTTGTGTPTAATPAQQAQPQQTQPQQTQTGVVGAAPAQVP